MFDFISQMNLVLFLFIITYAFIILYYHKKTYFIWATILLLFLLRILGPIDALRSVNWNVIGIYVGMLFISEMFIYSKAPEVLAEKIVNRSSRVWIAILGICALSGFISIVVENVAVVLIVAPVALYIAHKIEINPAPIIIGIAISSNLQGVATMIGDPPSLLLASHAGLGFNDFFFFQGRPGLFFAVQIAAVASLVVLYFIFKKEQKHVADMELANLLSYTPIIVFAIMIITLVLSSIYEYTGTSPILMFLSEYNVGIICVAAGLFIWLWYYTKQKEDFLPMVKRLDWDTAGFLIGIFIMVEALVRVGVMDWFASGIASLTGSSVFLAFNLIIWSSVIISGFVDNVPFIAAMLPVVGNVAEIMGVSPFLFYFGLVIGASVGGNITPVGASANIVAMGLLKKRGHRHSFWEFVKIGLPFTVVSVIASTTFIWFMFR